MAHDKSLPFAIRIQNTETKLFLTRVGTWTKGAADAAVLADPMEAIALCLRHKIRTVRFVTTKSGSGEEVYFYPFGKDPVVRLEMRKLRRSIRESRRLRVERRVIQARIDLLMAEGKEKKKQFPFSRKAITQEE